MNHNIGYISHQDNRLVPASYWAVEAEDDGMATKEYLVAKYRDEAIDALMECNASNKGFLTEAEIEESALIIAMNNGEYCID